MKYNLANRSDLLVYLDRFKSLPRELKSEMLEWPTVKKSPYSRSFYSSKEKRWDFTPEDCRRISDHWNFQSERSRNPQEIHCCTDRNVQNGSHWTLAIYTEGIWRVIASFPIYIKAASARKRKL